jgi:2-iminobutanoate/2-iminopropanoate deaminase
VKVTCYLTDLGEWEEMNGAYLEIFGPETPARIAVGCASLLFDAKVEFDCIAYRG